VHVWTQKASASNKTPYPATLLLLPLCSQPAFKGPVAFPATWPCPATGRLTQPAAPLLVSDLHATLISSATFCVRAAQRGALAIGTTHDPRCGNCGLPCSGPRGATRMPLAQRAHPSARASWSPSQTSHCLRAARMRARHQPRAPHRRRRRGAAAQLCGGWMRGRGGSGRLRAWRADIRLRALLRAAILLLAWFGTPCFVGQSVATNDQQPVPAPVHPDNKLIRWT